MESEGGKAVCVTGGSGYIASRLVKLLLLRGYAVHATVRDLDDPKKVDHLLALEGAKERLQLFKADLTEEGSFDAAVSGCDGVFHTASPCFLDCHDRDPKVALIDPAVKGTMNVLSSCAKFPCVRRVVLTSSTAAMLINNRRVTPETRVDETWFSDPDLCIEEKNWYAASKILAEEAAWRYAKEKGIDLVAICPGWVIGPLLQPALNDSCVPILNLVGAKTYLDVANGWVHVRDVAEAHIRAFGMQSASGRYCLVERDVHFSKIVNILKDSYPNLQFPDKCGDEKPYFPSRKYNNEKARSLGIDFIPFEVSVKEMMESYKEKQFL